MWFDMIKKYYDSKHPMYTDESLKTFVKAKMVFADQYFQITNKEYAA